MEILAHRALRGPNFYARFPATYMLLDIGELEDRPSDEIPGLTGRIKSVMPTLYSHRCSPGHEGGFFERLERGTWAGHIVEHLAIELQCLAGMEVGFGKTRETTTRGIYAVVYKHRDEACGIRAGELAVQILEALIDEQPITLEPIVQELRELREQNLLGPSTNAIVEAAEARDIPVMRLNSQSHLMLGQGVLQRHIQASMTSQTSALGIAIAADKEWTKVLLEEAGVSVPSGKSVGSLDEALALAERIGYPVVIKPLDANHGRGITTDIQSPEEVETAFAAAQQHHDRVVVERFLVGKDHRILIIDGKMIAAARRDPAHVIGNGKSTIQQLIGEVNADPRRGYGHEKMLTMIHVDGNTERMLKVQGLQLTSIPDPGQEVVLKSTANLSTGGTATDVTDEVHPAIRFMAERVAKIVGLDIMGIDVVAPHLQAPMEETGGGIVEVNAGPGLRMHLEPTSGTPRDVGKPIIDMLFPEGSGRIPTVAVTGTNGKTTTVRLIAHIMKYAGGNVGIACTGSIEVESQIIMRGDYSGPMGAQTILKEPTITHAVMEVARGGLLRRGMGMDHVDVGILLNVGRDHIGEGDIHDLDDLLRLKATVPDAARCAVLNADDERVLELKEKMPGRTILFSMNPDHPALATHLAENPENVAICYLDGDIVLRRDSAEFRVCPAVEIPITFGGKALFNIQNAMAAVAAGYALGFTEDDVRAALRTFNPTPTQNPGRMNVFDVGQARVVLDFGHNVPALEALDQVIPHLRPQPDGRILRVAYLAGNRLDEDLRAVGRALAKNCDRMWLSDPDPRGRDEGGAPGLMKEGALAAGLSQEQITTTIDEWPNLEAALQELRPGDLLICQCEDQPGFVARIRELQTQALQVTQ